VRVGVACASANKTVSTKAGKLICTKSGNKLIWVYAVNRSKPNPEPSKPSTLPISEGDDQFIYETPGCQNKIMFTRFNRNGDILRQNVLVNSSGNFQLTPKFYIQGTLLFESFDCTTKLETLYTLNLFDLNNPQIVFGPTQNVIIDATIDVASKTPLVLTSINNTYQVVTGGLVNAVLWTSQSTSGFYPQSLLTQTGYQFLVFGNYGCCGTKKGFGGFQVDYKQGFSSPYAYSPNLYLTNANAVIAGGGWNAPLAFSTEGGLFLCGMPSQYPLNIQTDANCVLVSARASSGAPMAISYGPKTSYDLIAGNSIYNYPFPKNLFSFNEKPLISSNIPNISSLVNNNTYVSTFEISRDLGGISPAWNYFGTYFSRN
jgi:hypothetical protein